MLLCIPFFPTSLTVLSLVLFSISFSTLSWIWFWTLSSNVLFHSDFFIITTSSNSVFNSSAILSSISQSRCFGGFALFVLVLFVWSIYPCCYVYCDIASMSYNLFFALLVTLLSQLLVQHRVLLLVDWISFLRVYLEFLLLTTFSRLPSHTGELALKIFQTVLT